MEPKSKDANTHDLSGRPWAKLSELRAGAWIETDSDFTCMDAGKREVFEDIDGLYVLCNDMGGHHYLKGQADDGEHLVGIYNV